MLDWSPVDRFVHRQKHLPEHNRFLQVKTASKGKEAQTPKRASQQGLTDLVLCYLPLNLERKRLSAAQSLVQPFGRAILFELMLPCQRGLRG